MFVSCERVCCQVEVSATGRSLVQRSPTDCGVCLECDQMKINLDAYCEYVEKVRATKRNETKNSFGHRVKEGQIKKIGVRVVRKEVCLY
jgi:hypothetical protein